MEDRAEGLGIGCLVEWDRPRDAIHIAIIPAVAGELLAPGQTVEMREGKAHPHRYGVAAVDPFLDAAVNPGERCWLFVRPGTITSLRHEWGHKDFPVEVAGHAEDSKTWLARHAADFDISYDDLIQGAVVEKGVCYGTERGREWSYIPGNVELFWHHVEAVVGRKFDADHRAVTYFSCSC